MQFKKISKKRILYISNDEHISYYKGNLYYEKNGIEINKCKIGNLLNKFRIIERMLRKEPRCAAKIDDYNFIISFGGLIIRYSVLDNSIMKEYRFEKGMNNPLEFLTVWNEMKKTNDIYFGEYIGNANKGPVSVYARLEGKWNKIYEFPANTIRHIHNIINDPYRDCFYILTGDKDSESGIWRADKEFRNVTPMFIGKQQNRACVAYPMDDGILYATDTPLEDNYIYKVSFDINSNVNNVKKICHIPGPCIYGTYKNGNYYFATSVEPDSSLSKWKYRFTYKLGKGVSDRYTHIIKVDKDGNYKDILSIKKDNWPMGLFQFGNVIFPKNDTNQLYVNVQSTKKGHGSTYKITEE